MPSDHIPFSFAAASAVALLIAWVSYLISDRGIVGILVGTPQYLDGSERITRVIDAAKYRIASLPWLDASVDEIGHVYIFRIR